MAAFMSACCWGAGVGAGALGATGAAAEATTVGADWFDGLRDAFFLLPLLRERHTKKMTRRSAMTPNVIIHPRLKGTCPEICAVCGATVFTEPLSAVTTGAELSAFGATCALV